LNDDPNVRTDIVAFAYRDMDFNCGNTLTLTGVSGASNGANARITFTAPIAPPGCVSPPPNQNPVSIYDLYLVESDSSQVAIMATNRANFTIDFAPTDPLNLNQFFNENGVN
jgi:hypothetical protein